MGFIKSISGEKIDILKEEYVLTVLGSTGINIEEFKKSELYCISEKELFFSHLYDVLHGSIYGKHNSNNECKIDLSQLKITFENNVLEIISADINYKYCIINGMLSVDGEKTLGYVATVNAPAIPQEKALEAMREFHKQMESRKYCTEDALQKSWEFAKTFKVR